MRWILQNPSDDPYVLTFDLTQLALDEGLEIEVYRSGETIVVESDDPIFRVEDMLDQLGEQYERR